MDIKHKKLRENYLYNDFEKAMLDKHGENWELHIYTHFDMADAYIVGATKILNEIKKEVDNGKE